MARTSGTYGATSHRGGERGGGECAPASPWAEMRFAGAGTRSDEDIRQDIRDRLNGQPQLASAAIEVEAEQGAVTLNGYVPDEWCMDQAEDLVRSTKGVTSVRNALRIELHGTGTVGNVTPTEPR